MCARKGGCLEARRVVPKLARSCLLVLIYFDLFFSSSLLCLRFLATFALPAILTYF
jgi:hypothetical protein